MWPSSLFLGLSCATDSIRRSKVFVAILESFIHVHAPAKRCYMGSVLGLYEIDMLIGGSMSHVNAAMGNQ